VTKPKPLTEQGAMDLAVALVTEHAWLKGEVRRLFQAVTLGSVHDAVISPTSRSTLASTFIRTS
jgi:hypothetical protein